MRIRSLLMGPAGLIVLAAFFFALGATAAFTPRTVDLVLLGPGVLVILAASVYAFRRFRVWPFLAQSLVLVIAVVATIVGNYIPYVLEIGDPGDGRYGSDDMTAEAILIVRLVTHSGMAVVVALAVGLFAPVIRWSLGRLRHAAAHLGRERQGAGLQHDD